MSNPEKMKVDDVTEEEKEEDSNEQWSDEELTMRDVVLALPALKISSEEVEKARLNEQAVVAAQLVMAAAEEAVMKEKSEGKKKMSRSRKKTKTKDEEAGGSGEKPKKKPWGLTNPPKGPPACNICGKRFGSWNAVFGHLRAHKDRNYQGFLPPPTFTAAAEVVTIPGPNSAFVVYAGRGGNSGGSRAPGGEGERDLGIDLNVDPVVGKEEDQGTTHESEGIAKFDLNKSPPKDDEDGGEKVN